MSTRTGLGWDTHAFAQDRALVIGGVTIEHTHGLLGHSDADVLCHAVTDALLGAAALGDIGAHFPDTDDAFAGADSVELLSRSGELVRRAGFAIVNVDATVIAEQPMLGPHREAMVENIAGALEVATSQVNVKFTRGEGMGYLGRGEGMAALATAAIE
ncbi:MAG: 2-C-methyl-D-erythritol 2,4-cyclodiphosphate synthase [Solirubrobacterales bacterium]